MEPLLESGKFNGEEMGLDVGRGDKNDGFGPEQNGEKITQSVGGVVACGGSSLYQSATTETEGAGN